MTNINNIPSNPENNLGKQPVAPDLVVNSESIQANKTDIFNKDNEREVVKENRPVANIEYEATANSESKEVEGQVDNNIHMVEKEIEEVKATENKYDPLTRVNIGVVNSQQAVDANRLAEEVKAAQEGLGGN